MELHELPELVVGEVEEEEEIYRILASQKPVEGLVMLNLALRPDRLREFAVVAHAFVRFWGPRRNGFVRERSFRDLVTSHELVRVRKRSGLGVGCRGMGALAQPQAHAHVLRISAEG